MLLLADAQGRVDSTGLFWLSFVNKEGSTAPVTLADCLRNNAKGGFKSSFDKTRHRGLMNVLFADGHVTTVMIGKNKDDISAPSGDLERIWIVK